MSKSLNWSEMIVDALGLGSLAFRSYAIDGLAAGPSEPGGYPPPPYILADTLTLF